MRHTFQGIHGPGVHIAAADITLVNQAVQDFLHAKTAGLHQKTLPAKTFEPRLGLQ